MLNEKYSALYNKMPGFDQLQRPVLLHDGWTNGMDQENTHDIVWGRPKILLDAVSKCRLRQLRLLLDAGINVNSRDSTTGQTALIRATFLEDPKLRRICTSMLVSYGAKVKVADNMKRTALSWACLLGRENSLKIFQSNPELDLAYDSVDVDGNTNLLLACMSGKANIVKVIARRFRRNRLDVNRKNNQGDTALSVAIRQRNRDIVLILVDVANVTLFGNPSELEFLVSERQGKFSKSASANRTKPTTAQRKPCNLPKIFDLYTEQLTHSYPRTCKSVASCKTEKEKDVERYDKRFLFPKTI